jgi:hypothetical protein
MCRMREGRDNPVSVQQLLYRVLELLIALIFEDDRCASDDLVVQSA